MKAARFLPPVLAAWKRWERVEPSNRLQEFLVGSKPERPDGKETECQFLVLDVEHKELDVAGCHSERFRMTMLNRGVTGPVGLMLVSLYKMRWRWQRVGMKFE